MDPALSDLSSIYARGDLVLFVGAGVSAAAGLPSWGKLVNELITRAEARGVQATFLEEVKSLVGKQQLIDALSALKDSLGGGDFCDAIEQLLDDTAVPEPPDVAKAIANLRGLRAVITTNLDHLLERAFRGDWPPMARATPDIAKRRRFILKLHGTLLDRSTWVFTREEYDRAMHADPVLKDAFGAFFNAYTLLFVGYGMADDDFDAVLARVRAFAGDQASRHFALVDGQTVTPYRKTKLGKAGVRLIPYDNADGRHTEATRILRSLAGGSALQTAAAPLPSATSAPVDAARHASTRSDGVPPSAPPARAHAGVGDTRAILNQIRRPKLLLEANKIRDAANKLRDERRMIYGMLDACEGTTVRIIVGGRSYRATISRDTSNDWQTMDKLKDAIRSVTLLEDKIQRSERDQHDPLAIATGMAGHSASWLPSLKTQLDNEENGLRDLLDLFIECLMEDG